MENLCERVTIVLGFTSDWMLMWREFFKPIVLQSNVKSITFRHTQVKNAPSPTLLLILWNLLPGSIGKCGR